LDWNLQGARRRGRLKQTWKRTILKEAGKCGKHGVRLRGWCETETDGNTSQIPCIPNGIKGYTTTTQNNTSSFNGACTLLFYLMTLSDIIASNDRDEL